MQNVGTTARESHPTGRNDLEPETTAESPAREPAARRASGGGSTVADLAAVVRCLAGDRDAFGEIVLRWQDRIYGAVLRMVRDTELARDLAQETFLRAFAKLSSFRGNAAVGTWLYSIAVNQVRSEMRRRAAQKYGSPLSLEALGGGGEGDADGARYEPADGAASAAQRAATKEDCALLLDELQRLDAEHREVLVLREFQGLSYDEIAAALDVPVGTVRSRLHRARGELRERLRGRVL